MKSRTSFFDGTVFKKNFTRFAPAWILYTLGLLMCLMLLTSGPDYTFPENLSISLGLMPIAGACFALLCALLLFGDLYNSRMCNALHAMPQRRETYFITHVVTGLTFNAIATGVFTLCSLPLLISPDAGNLIIALHWFVASNLQFIAFFGIALVSIFCAGNRFAAILVYGIVNFLAVLIYWMVSSFYVPLLYGIQLDGYTFTPFSPLVELTGHCCIEVDIDVTRNVHHDIIRVDYTRTVQGSEYTYLLICAGVGIALMAAALLMYRKRRLETAGDFIALRPLEPVFLILYTCTAAAVANFFYNLFLGGESFLFIIFGIFIGFFTGLMLLKRTVRVFTLKNIGGAALFLGCIAASLVLTLLDPLGIETRMPKIEEIRSVTLGKGYYYGLNMVNLTEPEDIQDVLDAHSYALEHRINDFVIQPTYDVPYDEDNYSYLDVNITYELKNGTTFTRYYTIIAQKDAGQLLKPHFSTLQCLFGDMKHYWPEIHMDLTTAEGVLDNLSYVCIDPTVPPLYETQDIRDKELLRQLVFAMAADCAEGNFAPIHAYHRDEENLYYIGFQFGNIGQGVNVFSSARHTVAFLEEQGYLTYPEIEQMEQVKAIG